MAEVQAEDEGFGRAEVSVTDSQPKRHALLIDGYADRPLILVAG
jgi:hypothetical protein